MVGYKLLLCIPPPLVREMHVTRILLESVDVQRVPKTLKILIRTKRIELFRIKSLEHKVYT